MKSRINSCLFLLVLFYFLICANADVKTSVSVKNTGPVLQRQIPDVLLMVNETRHNAINLSYYFMDPNGDKLSFYHSPVENLTIFIDQETGIVSLIAQPNFIGRIFVTFYASDGEYNSSSNNVTINIGFDEEPPKWFYPQRNKEKVFQSSKVNFTTLWVDNLMLSGYLFSINQGNGWMNSSAINFTGTQNLSNYQFQISAAANTKVQWVFYAWDWQNNTNVTDIQEFVVSGYSKEDLASSFYEDSEVMKVYSKEIRKTSPTQKYSIDTDRLKVTLKQGESISRTIKITSQTEENLTFNVYISGINNLARLNKEKFVLGPRQSIPITIDFSAKEDEEVGEYFGAIMVSSVEETMIPVVVEVKPFVQEFVVDVQIPQKYKIVRQGGKVYANLSISSVRDIRNVNATLIYSIKDYLGKIYDIKSKEISFYDKYTEMLDLDVPGDALEGEYIFYAKIQYGNIIDFDADIFSIGSKIRLFAFFLSFWYIIIGIILIVTLLILLVLYKRSRQKRRLLELYLMLNELKSMVFSKNYDAAISLYIKIKREYGEPIKEETLKNKEKLIEELKKFAESIGKSQDANSGDNPKEEKENTKKQEINS